MISRFFLDHPIFAIVIGILIVLGGLVALKALPIEQYPNITPPQIQVTANYPGASAETMADSVAAPLESQINGTENMIYMYSQNSSAGVLTLNVFFDIGSDVNQALNNVQNNVNLALSQLPDAVQRQGVTVKKQTPTILLLVAIQSPDGRYDDIFTSNYSNLNVVQDLQLLKGISNVTIIGVRNYSMRIWLRPDLMAQLGITTTDIVNAVQEQNSDYAVGQLGQEPTSEPVLLNFPVGAQGRLATPEEFENIVIRADQDGSYVLIKDIGHVDLGAQNYSVNGELNNKATTLIAIYQEYGANALDVADEVKKSMEKISKNFPVGLTYSIPYDTTIFVKASISDVAKTLFESAILVTIVVLIFLHSIRATLIPVIAMLISIVGTFIGMYLLGFSLNTLTMFGLVLAIGIVVDDAIVVVENVERNLRQNKLSAKEAALRAMEEVTGPVIAIVFVLCSVFIPIAFLGGIAGELYKQFAITISVSVFFSGLIALILSPVLAAYFLTTHRASRLGTWFNKGFDKITSYYLVGATLLVKRVWLGLILFAVVLGILIILFQTIPSSFVPDEDQGYLIGIASLPDAASLQRTTDVSHQAGDIALKNPATEHFVGMSGFSLLENLNRTQIGTYFIILKDWAKRSGKSENAFSVLSELQTQYSEIPQAQIMVFNPPAIQGLNTVGGFEFWIVNRGDANQEQLAQITRDFLTKAQTRPELAGLSSSVQANGLQLYIDLDRIKTKAYHIKISEAYQTLQALLGSVFINNFNKGGRVYQVIAQADPAYRARIDDIGNIYVRSADAQMIPLKSIVTTKFSNSPTLISRFNGFPAAKITGSAAAGFSSGQAIKAMTELAEKNLPEDMTVAWSGQAYQEIESGGTSTIVLIAALVMIFLILAALYERWSLPLAVLLAIPFGIFGAFIAVWLAKMTNDVYFQIGLVTLIALAAKNAILIIEFAIMKRAEGMSAIDAALEAAKLRFRAIMMTSLTMIIGVLPLVLSTGAGANSRHSVGVGVMGGMITATFIGIFFIPMFYRMCDEKRRKK